VGKKSWLTVVVLVLNSLPSCIHIMFRFVKEEEIILAVVVISPDIQLCSAMFHHSSVVLHWHTCRNPENGDLARCIHRALSRSVLRSATQFAASLHCQPFTQPSQLLSFSALLSWYPGIQGFETEIEKHYCQSPTSIVFWPGGLPGLWYSIKSAILLDAKRGRFLEPSLDRGSCNSCLVPHFRLRYSLHRIIEGIEVCERL